jgi:hypothetical protein
MTKNFDVDSVIKSIIERILNVFLSLILLTNFKSLYDWLVKLDIISEKRLMIDLMCLRQLYERREIAEIRWIDDTTNSTDAMIKSKFCSALIKFIDTNNIELRIIQWVERTMKHSEDQNLWWSKPLMIKIFDDLITLISNDWTIDS